MLQFSQHNILSRAHVLRMTMLSQRAVDYSIKAYRLNSAELCRQVMSIKRDLSKLEVRIGDRGRAFVAAGAHIDSHSPFACSSLRIYSSLRVMFTAATEIAQNITILAALSPKTIFPQTVETGNTVNSLVRLCSVALFDQKMSLAKQVLHIEGGRRRLDLELHRARLDLFRRSDTHCRCELAIANCIGQIAEQVYETAEGIIAWLENGDCVHYAGPNTMSAQQTGQYRLWLEHFAGFNRTRTLTLQ
jgi:hypothetical protein